MATKTIAQPEQPLERLLAQGDLSQLTPEQRADYYVAICQSLNLNPLTRPFEFITLSGKLLLYAKKDCTEQLRKLHKVSIEISDRSTHGDLFFVTAKATISLTGIEQRTDESIGAVSLLNLKGDAAANAIMKAETKAKRRVTLSICGLGCLDETELETISAMPDKPKPELKALEPDTPAIHSVPTVLPQQEKIATALPVASDHKHADTAGAFNEEPPDDNAPNAAIPRAPGSKLYITETKILKDALAELVKLGYYESRRAAWDSFKEEFKVDGFDSLTIEQYQPILTMLRGRYVMQKKKLAAATRAEILQLSDLISKLVRAGVYKTEIACTEDLRSVFDGKTIIDMSGAEVREAIVICQNKIPIKQEALTKDDCPF
jgi:hypothetical protein